MLVADVLFMVGLAVAVLYTHQSWRAGELASEYCKRTPRCSSNSTFHQMLKETQGVAIASRWAMWSQANPAAIRSDQPWYELTKFQNQMFEQNLALVASVFGMTPDGFRRFTDDFLTSYYQHVVLAPACPAGALNWFRLVEAVRARRSGYVRAGAE